MFVRRTTYKMAPDFDSEEGQRAFENALRDALRPQDIDGLINTTHVPNNDGTWSVVAIWADRQFADTETLRIRAAWEALSNMLVGPPRIEVSGIEFNETW